MTKIEQLVAAVKLANPELTEDSILEDLLAREFIYRGYVIDESIELEPNVGTAEPARLVKNWVVLKDGRPVFQSEIEAEAIDYRNRRLREDAAR
jgi:hypothetical protein